ncbi:fibronectin type III domain-containing protein, partial [Fulvivirga kasyanovii]
LVGVEVQPDNTLLKTGGWGSDNGGAASAEVLAAGTDGWAEFTVYPTSQERYFGLTQNNVDATKNMDYAIKISSINTIVIQENGISRAGYGDIEPGEVFRVERTGTTIEYKRGGSTFHISEVPSTTSLRVDACIYHNNGEIQNGTLNFGAAHVESPNAPTTLQSTTVTSNSVGLQWADNASDETGFIIERQSGTGTYEQVANLPSNTTSYTDGTVAGAVSYTYRVYAYNSGGNSSYSNALTVTTEVASREGFPVTWTDLTGVEVLPDNTLRKTAGWGIDNGGATSVEILPAGTDGWAEFIVYGTNHERYFGLTENSTDATNNIDYAFKISSTNTIVVNEQGSNKYGIGGFEDGDILRIERTGTTITYKRNGDPYYDSETPSTGPLMVDVSIYHSSGEIKGSAISFEAMVAPEIPDRVQAIATDFDKNLIKWEAQDPAISYEIERSLSQTGGFARVATTVRGARQYKDSKLTGGTTYYYRVRATNGQEFSAYSHVVSSTTKTAVATENTLAHKPQYNGNISAIKWKAHGDAEEKLYTYSYD